MPQSAEEIRAANTDRARRSRARRAAGEAVVAVALPADVLAALEELGWLEDVDRGEAAALAAAVAGFVAAAVVVGRAAAKPGMAGPLLAVTAQIELDRLWLRRTRPALAGAA